MTSRMSFDLGTPDHLRDASSSTSLISSVSVTGYRGRAVGTATSVTRGATLQFSIGITTVKAASPNQSTISAEHIQPVCGATPSGRRYLSADSMPQLTGQHAPWKSAELAVSA